jgi:hypothetical protein
VPLSKQDYASEQPLMEAKRVTPRSNSLVCIAKKAKTKTITEGAGSVLG